MSATEIAPGCTGRGHLPNVRRVLGIELSDHESDPAEEEGSQADRVEPSHRSSEQLHVGAMHDHVGSKEGDDDGDSALAGRRARGARLEALGPVEEPGVEARHAVDAVLHAVPLDGAPQRSAHEADHNRVREARADGDRAEPIQCLVLPANQQGRRARALRDGPVGPGVGGGDEVEHQPGENEDAEKLAHVLAIRHHDVEDRVVKPAARQRAVSNLLQRQGSFAHRLHVDISKALAVGMAAREGRHVESKLHRALHLDAKTSEDREEEEAIEHGEHERADEDLPDGAPAGDARHEHAHEGRPRNPPSPVEDGPPVQEAAVVRAVELGRIREVLTRCGGELRVEAVVAGVGEQVSALDELEIELLECVGLESDLNQPLEVETCGLRDSRPKASALILSRTCVMEKLASQM
eukprot:669995-Rhodomonas_salina.4